MAGAAVVTQQGTTVHISYADYDLEMIPEQGARVVSLKHGRHGEWLAGSARRWPARLPTTWDRGDTRGWDECVPNISPGTHPQTGTPLADHGEVWNRPWDWQPTLTGARTRIGGRLLPFEFQRDLGLTLDGLTARYRLENVSDQPYSVNWAMHLLLRGTPGELAIADDVQVRFDSVFGTPEPKPLGWFPWARIPEMLPFTEAGWAAKLFTRPGDTESVTMAHDNGALTVSLRDAPVPPTFGLWMNAGGWPDIDPLIHVGVEPGFGDHDSLAESIHSETALQAEPRIPYSWKVELQAS